MKKALVWFANLYLLWVIIANVVAMVYPPSFKWFTGQWVTWALSLVMLGMGLTLHVSDFRRIGQMPYAVGVGVGAQYVIMPCLAWAIASALRLPPAFAAGLILVGSCPGGTASNVVTFLARANVALSVVLTMLSTLLAAVMTPFLTKWLAGQYVPVDAWGILRSTLQVVIAPVLLGVYINHKFPKISENLKEVGPAVAVLAIVMIAGSIVSRNVEVIHDEWLILSLAALLLHSAGFALGYWISRLLKLPQQIARTISIEVGMQNSGLAMVLAFRHFSPATAIPAVFSSIFHTLAGSICAAYWSRHPPVDAEPSPVGDAP
jgi:bile acid:Na+ symporter, BASS family